MLPSFNILKSTLGEYDALVELQELILRRFDSQMHSATDKIFSSQLLVMKWEYFLTLILTMSPSVLFITVTLLLLIVHLTTF